MNLRKTWAIAVREFGYYFVSPIVYGFLSVFLFLNGFFTVDLIVTAQRAEISTQLLLFIFMVLAPILTMRLISSERSEGTIELIFTSPVRSVEYVLGKYIAVLGVYGVALLFSMEFPIFLVYVGDPDIFILATQFLGLLLVGGAFLAIGLFFSCVTENQIIAAVTTFCFLLILWVFSIVQGMVPSYMSPVVEAFDLASRIQNFQQGLVTLSDLTFFLSFIVIFLYSSVLYLNARSWQQ